MPLLLSGQSYRRRAQIRLWLGIAIAVSSVVPAVCYVLVHAFPRERPLLPRSVKIASKELLGSSRPRWLAVDQIGLVDDDLGPVRLPLPGASLSVLNTRTGQKSRVRRLLQWDRISEQVRGTVRFSPDHRWRLVHYYGRRQRGVRLYPAGAGSDPVLSIPLKDHDFGYRPSIAWHPGGRVWSLLERRNGVWYLSDYRMGSSRPRKQERLTFLCRDPYWRLDLVGFSSAGNPIIARTAIVAFDSPLLWDFTEVLDARTRSLRQVRFRRPASAEWSEDEFGHCAVSPRGDRIAWVFACARAGGWLPPGLKKHLPFLEPERTTRQTVELWTSAIDGTDMRPVGSHPVEASSSFVGLGGLVWAPDGNRICFSYQGNFYGVTPH